MLNRYGNDPLQTHILRLELTNISSKSE